ncbi:MAG: flavodoxin family protein [Romboutsia sp.]
MKLCAIIGSNSIKSNTYIFTKNVVNELEKSIENLEVTYINLKDYNIEPCKNCLYCKRNTSCIIDTKDNMNYIREVLIGSDIIIFASPVYVNNISGTMKNFIDRMHSWTHIMRLAGKYGIVLATASQGGVSFVKDYLNTVFTYLGVDIIGGYHYYTDIKEEEENFVIEKIVNETIDKTSKDKFVSTFIQEYSFQHFKKIFSKYLRLGEEKIIDEEANFWIRNNLINYIDYQSVLNDVKLGKLKIK